MGPVTLFELIFEIHINFERKKSVKQHIFITLIVIQEQMKIEEDAQQLFCCITCFLLGSCSNRRILQELINMKLREDRSENIRMLQKQRGFLNRARCNEFSFSLATGGAGVASTHRTHHLVLVFLKLLFLSLHDEEMHHNFYTEGGITNLTDDFFFKFFF